MLIGRIHGRIREKGGWRGVTRRPRVAIFRDPSQRLPAAFRAQIAQGDRLGSPKGWHLRSPATAYQRDHQQTSHLLPIAAPRSSQEQRPASSPDPHSDINARSPWQVCLRACCCVHGMHAVSPPHQVTPFGTLLIPWCWCSIRRQAGREDAKPVRGRCASCTYCHDSLRRPSAIDRSNCLLFQHAARSLFITSDVCTCLRVATGRCNSTSCHGAVV